MPSPAPPPVTEIRSASTELLGSESMAQLRSLLKETSDERDVLAKEIAIADSEANAALSRFQKWERGFLLKRIRKQAFVARKEVSDTAAAKLEELQEQLRLTTLAMEITVDREQGEPYYRMRDEFSSLCQCAAIWDTLTQRAVNQVAERTVAGRGITRGPASFTLGRSDLIQWDNDVPHIANCTGGDLYLYPGFLLYRISKQAFSLIDCREVSVEFSQIRFIEEGNVPADARVIGQTWAKANKDGSPDRRFSENFQIPIVLYGCIVFKSATGLWEEFQFSNADRAERFAKSWNAFGQSFGSGRPSDKPRATVVPPVPVEVAQAPGSSADPALLAVQAALKNKPKGTAIEQNGFWFAWSADFPEAGVSANSREEAVAKITEVVSRLVGIEIAFSQMFPRDDPLSTVAAALGTLKGADDIGARFRLSRQFFPRVEAISSDDSDLLSAQPLIEDFARFCAASLDTAGVGRICDLAGRNPDAPFIKYFADRAVGELEYASAIIEEISARPGITQFAVRTKLNIPKSDMASILQYMEGLGLVLRTPTERTFRLYPGRLAASTRSGLDARQK
jgi:hypothetical protein